MEKALTPELVNDVGGKYFRPDVLTSWKNSGKITLLRDLLSDFYGKGFKTLIFSNSLRALELIQSFVIGKGWKYSRLDGNTYASTRQSLVNDFNKDPTKLIFLISTKAGGTGLNLQSASKVIVFDCNWNPAWDMQAQDRAYRFGQDRPVQVFRLISQGTIEEMIYMRQLYKKTLQDAILNAATGDNQFDGIEGDKSCHGELFGAQNILQFHDGRLKCHYSVFSAPLRNHFLNF